MRIKSLSLLLVFCLVSSSFISAQETKQETTRGAGVVSVTVQDGKNEKDIKFYDGSYALVIGISKYTNGWDELPGVLEDVQDVKKAFEGHDFKVETAINLTSEELKKRIETFIADYGIEKKNQNNRLIVYFAGHGFTDTTSDGRKIGYIIPADCPQFEKNIKEFNLKAISMSDIDSWAKKIRSKHALFIFDSCFSGSIIERGEIAYPDYITEQLERPVRQYLTSGSANQTVSDNSVFRKKLVLGLNGESDLNEDGFISARELAKYLKDQVTSSTKNRQTPQYAVIDNQELSDGDMVFRSEKTKNPNRSRDSAMGGSRKTGSSQSDSELAGTKMPEFKIREFMTITVTDRNGTKKSARSYDEDISSVKLEMVEIPEGTFKMGSNVLPNEKPVRDVSVKNFYMSIYEITQAQWRAVAQMDKIKIKLEKSPSREHGDDLPVENVSWEMAEEFCKRLSKYTGREYTLPTEAEWEYAARANTTTQFSFGDRINTEVANYDGLADNLQYGSSNGTFRRKTIPVGNLKFANAFGLYDMHGNVAEWCLDTFHGTYNNAPTDGNIAWIGELSRRIVRGGHWNISASSLRSSYRNNLLFDTKSEYIGFRVVMRSKLTK